MFNRNIATVLFCTAAIFTLCATGAQAATIASYDFAGGSRASLDTEALTTATDWVTTAGDVSSLTGTAYANASVAADSLAASITGDDYHSFTVEANGNTLNLENLTFNHSFTNGWPSFTFDVYVMTSATGFTDGDEIATFGFAGDGNHGPIARTVDLSGSEFQGLTSDFETRFYFVDTSTSNQRLHRLDDVKLNAVVAVVPEPSTFALAALGLLGCVLRRRR